MLKSFLTRNRASKSAAPRGDRPSRACLTEPLEERLMMALCRAGGGSGYSGTLSTNPTIRQQQLICDPAEPAQGSTSVLYDASKVSLAGYQYGPGYGPMPLPIEGTITGYVEVQVTPTVRRLQLMQSFLDQPSGSETGYVQMFYALTGSAGQLQPPQGFAIRDEGGVDGVDTHALFFEVHKDIPDPNIDARYTVFAAPEGTHSGNVADFMRVNDGSGKIITAAEILPTTVSTKPTDGSLAGFAFEDSNADGVFGAGESGIADVTVYLDANNNGTREATEAAQVTDEEGHYLFENLRPGTYLVREITPAGYLPGLTVPTSGVNAVTVVPGLRQRNVNFGSIRNGAVSGVVWKDLNGNGVRERVEPPMGGATVYVDFNNNGQQDAGEPRTASALNGTWSIAGLRPGAYVVREVVPADYVQTAPAAGFQTANVLSGQTATGNSFGNRMPAPRVTAVYLSGPTWTQAYRNFLQAANLGDSVYGYRMNPAGGRDVSMMDPDRISVRFDHPVSADALDLTAASSVTTTTYPVSGYSYDPATKTATWTLARPVLAERLVITLNAAAGGVTNTDGTPLDGEWPAGAAPRYPSGNGTPGGNFQIGVNVLGGDSNGDGSVNALDVADVKARLNRSTTSPGTGNTAYSLFADVAPDTRINALDVAAVKQRLGRRLPRIIIFPPPIPIDPIDPIPIIPIIPSPPDPLPIPYPNVTLGAATSSITHDVFADATPIA
jgi:hypothetical protein